MITQRVHRWVARYREGGLAALAGRSHAPKAPPWRLSAGGVAVICDLRARRGWGSRRLVFGLERRVIRASPGPRSAGSWSAVT